MEEKPVETPAVHYEKGAGTAVQQDKDGKRYVIADGALSNLFTKALQVRFDRNDNTAELSNQRPTDDNMLKIAKGQSETNDSDDNASVESAAQDTFLQAAIANSMNDQVQPVTDVSRIRVTRNDKPKAGEVFCNPTLAFNDLCDLGIDIDFVFVVVSEPYCGGTETNYYNNKIIENVKNKSFPGQIKGLISNEMREVESVEVVVKYKS